MIENFILLRNYIHGDSLDMLMLLVIMFICPMVLFLMMSGNNKKDPLKLKKDDLKLDDKSLMINDADIQKSFKDIVAWYKHVYGFIITLFDIEQGSSSIYITTILSYKKELKEKIKLVKNIAATLETEPYINDPEKYPAMKRKFYSKHDIKVINKLLNKMTLFDEETDKLLENNGKNEYARSFAKPLEQLTDIKIHLMSDILTLSGFALHYTTPETLEEVDKDWRFYSDQRHRLYGLSVLGHRKEWYEAHESLFPSYYMEIIKIGNKVEEEKLNKVNEILETLSALHDAMKEIEVKKPYYNVNDILTDGDNNTFVIGKIDENEGVYIGMLNLLPAKINIADQANWKKTGVYSSDDAINKVFEHCKNNRRQSKNKK